MRHISYPLTGAVAVFFAFSTAPSALPLWAHQRAELFATCAGRLEATSLGHDAMDRDTRGQMSAKRRDFEFLLEAVTPAALDEDMPETMPKLWKAKGWTEMAHLLAEIKYAHDQSRAERAAETLGKRLQECDGILLS